MNLDISIAKIAALLLIIPFSLLMDGLRRKVIARMQNRVGPPIWQTFLDLLKLYQKGESDSLAEENIFFRAAPLLYFLTTLSLFIFVPLSLLNFEYDFILLVYILILESALFVLAAFSSNSPFGIIAATREITLLVCYELVLAVVIVTVFVFTGETSMAYLSQTWLALKLPIALICFYYVTLVEVKITPYDTAEAAPEIMAGVESEFSGKGLMLLEMAKAMKRTFFAMLITILFFGYFNILVFTAFTVGFILLFSFTCASTARYKVDQALSKMVIVLVFALVEFVRIRFFVW